jgi:hypothetical protein
LLPPLRPGSFSGFCHRPRQLRDELRSAGLEVADLVSVEGPGFLRRRDAGDLALMRIEQLERDESVVEFTARLLAGLVKSENSEVIRRLLPEAVPWVTFLPETDFDVFVTELVAVARGAAALGNLAPLAVLLTQWRHSAEVYADPVLLEIVTREPEGDLGPVPAPPDTR